MILDTNAVSALFEGKDALASALESEEHHHLPVIVIGEYRYGLLFSRHRRHLSLLLDTLIRKSWVLSVGVETAVCYSTTRQDLRVAGTPIPENDIWISALARQHGLPILSQDEHFDRVEGIERISW